MRVALRVSPPEVELVVEDDGVGGIDQINGGNRRGLGQRIINGMADKLEGSLVYEDLNPGTRAILKFPIGNQIKVVGSAPAAS